MTSPTTNKATANTATKATGKKAPPASTNITPPAPRPPSAEDKLLNLMQNSLAQRAQNSQARSDVDKTAAATALLTAQNEAKRIDFEIRKFDAEQQAKQPQARQPQASGTQASSSQALQLLFQASELYPKAA
jgi:hypothetical protein